MRKWLVGGCFLLAGLASAAAPAESTPPGADQPLSEVERAQRLTAVEPGLSPDQVRRLIGAPRATSRQVLYHRCLEQWLYESPFSVRLEFDRPRGQEPRLLSVQPLDAARP